MLILNPPGLETETSAEGKHKTDSGQQKSIVDPRTNIRPRKDKDKTKRTKWSKTKVKPTLKRDLEVSVKNLLKDIR